MKKMDTDGLLLCDIQGQVFELSIEKTSTSSEIFIRRFMNSQIVKLMDNESILDMTLQADDIIHEIKKEYNNSEYGSIKYTKNEMYWIGYIYRYFSYIYECSSKRVYRIIKPKELRQLYLPYHTLSPEQTIERILEAKDIDLNIENDINKQFEIYKKIREGH
ncbi:antitoxin [Floccifex sp.]|uniref:antitoxin n=1 Tax=Floccifex sp. TaxID=2815810 RepID=UPI003EFF1BF2